MKKIFTLIAVAMMAINAMAQKTVTVALDDNALTNLGAGSYITEVKDVEATWTFDGTDFLVSNICRNAKNQPAGYSGDQFIQVKGSTTVSARGYIINKEAMDLASLVLTTPTATEKVIVSAGTSADELTEVTPTISTVDLEVKTYNSTTRAEGTGTKTLNVLTYDLTGMKFVKITASSALHIWSAVIGLAEETTDEDTFNITVTDGKLTVAPTNAERGYYFGMVSAENWAAMQAEGYTFKSLVEEDVEDCTYDELVDWMYIFTGTFINGWDANVYMLGPGEYYFFVTYIDKDLTVAEPVVVKLIVDEQGNFVLDESTDDPSTDDDTFNVTVADGKLTLAPTNAERAYWFGLMSQEQWASLEAEGYTAKSLVEEEIEDCTYAELIDWMYIYKGTILENFLPSQFGMPAGEYILIAAYIDEDLSVAEPVVVKLTVDDQNHFVLDTPTSIKNANVVKQIRKFIENGKIVMMKDGKKFNAAGMLVK